MKITGTEKYLYKKFYRQAHVNKRMPNFFQIFPQKPAISFVVSKNCIKIYNVENFEPFRPVFQYY